MSQDRTKASFRALAALDPMIPYRVLYRAKVVAQDGDSDVVDVRPDDPDLPDMARIPLRHGAPGLRVAVPLGSYLLVGWDDGRPDKPFAALWSGGIVPAKVSIQGDQVKLGSNSASHPVPKGDNLKSALSVLSDAVATFGNAAASLHMEFSPAALELQAAITAFQQMPWNSEIVSTT